MKTIGKVFLIALTINVFLSSCTGRTAKQTSDSVKADSSDTIVLVEGEPSAPNLLITPDLTLLEVKGNVKEIKGKCTDNWCYGGSAKFDENGTLTHYGCSEPIDKLSHIKRDKDGKLTYFLAADWTTIKWDNNQPLSAEHQFNEFTETETYQYDDKGKVIKITHRYQDFGEETDDTTVETVIYPDDAFDKNGNWIKRIVKFPDHKETQIREITYY